MENLTDNRFWQFVAQHLGDDPSALRLKYHRSAPDGIDIALAITQIECRRKFGKKLHETLEVDPRFLFPDTLAGEQSTSDALAAYHCSLLLPSSSVVDLTAGLGVDALTFARRGHRVVAVELDEHRASALRYNGRNISGIEVANADCRKFLERCESGSFDVAFIDPARRADDGSRVYDLSQCSPDVVGMLPQISRVARRLIVKMSPMLDISRTLEQLPSTERIIALGTPTECKELVAVVDFKELQSIPDIEAVTVSDKGTDIFSFTRAEEMESQPSYMTPRSGNTLYELYPSLMKAAPFHTLCRRFGLHEVAPNSHVFFSEKPVESVPAERYEVLQVLPYASKVIKRLHKDYPALAIATRNFKSSPDTLRKKLGVKDNEEYRLIATTDYDGIPFMIICRKLPAISSGRR